MYNPSIKQRPQILTVRRGLLTVKPKLLRYTLFTQDENSTDCSR